MRLNAILECTAGSVYNYSFPSHTSSYRHFSEHIDLLYIRNNYSINFCVYLHRSLFVMPRVRMRSEVYLAQIIIIESTAQ